MDIGTIKMRTPANGKSAIKVSKTVDGVVDVHITRTDEGEALLRIPNNVAAKLSALLAEAVK